MRFQVLSSFRNGSRVSGDKPPIPSGILAVLSSKFSQDVLWNMISLGLLALGGIVVNLIILKFRGAEALGVFNQVYAVYIVISQIAVGGVQFSVLNHVSHNQDNLVQCAEITTSALILVGVIAGLISVLSGLLAEPIGDLLESPDVAAGLLYAAPGLFFFSLNKVQIMALNGLRHMRAFAVFRALRFVLIPLCVSVLLALDLPSPYLLILFTLTEIVLFICLLLYINVRVFPLKVSSRVYNWFPRHISFGLRGMLSGILIELNTRVDVLMLGYFSTDAMVGIYSFAAMLAEGFGQIPLVFRWNVDPIMGQHFAEGREWKISEMSRRIRSVFHPLMAVAGIGVVMLYPLFFRLLLPGEDVGMSWSVFAIIMVGVVINAGYRPFTGIMLQGGRPGTYTLLIGGLVLADALLNLVFIPLFGIYGAAMVTAVTYTAEVVLLVICARKLFGVRL